MQAIILAAGKSTRTYPLTLTRPKPLLKVANRTLLEHNLDQLSGLVNEVLLIVSYKKELITKKFGPSYKDLKLTYIEQKEPLGTGHALLQAENHAQNKFLVIYGDDLYSQKDLKKLLSHQYALLAKEVEDVSPYAAVITEKNLVKDIIEKPSASISNLANIGAYSLDKKIFSILKTLKKSPRGEYELPDLIKELAQKESVHYELVQDYWLPIPYIWSLLDANEFLLKRIKTKIDGQIEEGVTLKGEIIIGKNTFVKSGAYLEGPLIIGENCLIGPRAYLRPYTSIGNNCRLGAEIKNSLIMDNTNVAHSNSYLGDSILGENINLGSGTVTANVRHDKKPIKVTINNQRISSGKIKLGAFIGDNTKIGINASLMPGVKISPNSLIPPHELVNRDYKK